MADIWFIVAMVSMIEAWVLEEPSFKTKTECETFAAKQMLIEPKYDTVYSYQDKRLNIYKSIKEDLEKLINKEGAELPPHI